jgi:hypothetical protein
MLTNSRGYNKMFNEQAFLPQRNRIRGSYGLAVLHLPICPTHNSTKNNEARVVMTQNF